MSKLKADFGTPEKENISVQKRLAPQQHPVHIEMSGRRATLDYVTMLRLRLCSVTFALSASSLRVTSFLFQKLYQKI